jgi:alpha-amylase/alpha-mannosidase (GH57 family)
MTPLYVAFLWHYHQPYYTDPVKGTLALPWVRLHAVKDYVGLANLWSEFPAVRQSVNFVPSLVKQLAEYLGGAEDTALTLARVPSDELTEDQAADILRTFFAANRENLIHPHPRYRQLMARCDLRHRTAEEVARELSPAELRDLQVWANLAWFHPSVVEADPDLGQLIKQNEGYTEVDKRAVLAKQMELIAEIVPLHRRLADAGRIELTTSPFYHAIVPLLCNHTAARAGTPGLPPPTPMLIAPRDAAEQVERALTFHAETFGRPARGLWPSECAVSNDAAGIFARAGVEWVVTDEEILAQTLRVPLFRTTSGVVNRPDLLYRPYRLRRGGRELAVIFRDHTLSDRIGFRYQLRPPDTAADDLVARLLAIRDAAPENALVTIALDGENCWEFYPNQGVDFLRCLYRRLSDTPEIETVTISDYLDRFGVAGELERLFPGTWIGHSFRSWMGHWEKNRAWEHLTRARDFARRRIAEGAVPDGVADAVREETLIAEGSDWFWWYGDEHAGRSDATFDALFRLHLRRIYELLDTRPPDDLLRPIMDFSLHEVHTPPRALLDITVDGRRTSFFEWLGAGSYRHTHDEPTMQRAEPVPVTAMHFGFCGEALALRLDLTDAYAEADVPLGAEIWLEDAEEPFAAARFAKGDVVTCPPDGGIDAARGRVIEMVVPLATAGLRLGSRTAFFVRVLESDSAVQRIPAASAVRLDVPENFETAYPNGGDLV